MPKSDDRANVKKAHATTRGGKVAAKPNETTSKDGGFKNPYGSNVKR